MGRKPKIEGLCPFGEGKLGPHLTQCHLDGAYLPSKWHLDPSSHLATTDKGRGLYRRRQNFESGGLLRPFLWGGAGSPSNTMWPGPRPTCMPSLILIHPTIWPKYTNVTHRQRGQDRTNRTTVR